MTKYRNSRSRAILKFYGEAHVSSYTIDILKKHLLTKAPTKQGKKVNPPQNRIVYSHNDLDNAVRIDNQWAEDLQDSKPKKCNCIMSGYAQTTNYCPVHKKKVKKIELPHNLDHWFGDVTEALNGLLKNK